MKIQDFNVQIIKELTPQESYTIAIEKSNTGEKRYENLRVLKEHYHLSDQFKIGHRVNFKGAEILITGPDLNLNTSVIVTQSPLKILKEELSTIKCTINDIVIDDYMGQIFTARLIDDNLEIKSDYINIIPTNMAMKGVGKGVTMEAKGIFLPAKLYGSNNRRTTVNIFFIKSFEILP